MSDILKIGSGKIAWNASGNIGIILILLGLTVIFGWHAGSTTLVSVHGSFVAMQYNAALGFVLCGIGLLARGFDWREAGYTAGALLLALSGSILVEHQFDIDLGISRFFFSEPSLALAALVSPMSEISAFCFLLAGTVLLLSMGAGHRKACRMLGGVLSVVIVAFGVVAIVGYIGGWNTAYGRSQAMGVAFHTALGFIVTGTGLFATGLDRSEWTEHWPRWVSGLVAIGMIILSVALWQELLQDYAESVRQVPGDKAALLLDDVAGARTGADRAFARMPAGYSVLPEIVLVAGVTTGLLFALCLNYAFTLRAMSARAIRSEKRLALILDNVGEAIFGLDRHGRTTFVNKAAEKLLGYSAEELIGQSPHALPNGPADRVNHPISSRGIRESLDQGIQCSSAEEVFSTRNGGTILVEYTSQPIHGEDGAIAGAVVVFRDIAERKSAEAERDRLIKMLTRSNDELDGFAHIASHDLKEPLRAIHNHAQFLLEDYGDVLDENGTKRLKRLGYLTERMERLISDLLNFSKLGREELSIREIDLNEVIADIEKTLGEKLWEQNATISVPRPLPTVQCDTVRITELFRNLIVNALKYNESQAKHVEIGCSNPNNPVFYVKDNGIGIDAEFHTEIFRIFKRLHSDKQYAGGTGAGLTFVKKIVEQHHGKIWLSSSKGEGTTFFFTLKGG